MMRAEQWRRSSVRLVYDRNGVRALLQLPPCETWCEKVSSDVGRHGTRRDDVR